MPVAEEKRAQFIAVMFNLVKSLKRETDICCNLCGPVSEKELLILVFVGQNGNVTMSELASTLGAPLSTLTSIVDKLVEKKYLLRTHSDSDRRVVNVTLAAKGKESYKVFLRQKKTMAEKVLAQLNEKEQNSLLQVIDSLAASIDGVK